MNEHEINDRETSYTHLGGFERPDRGTGMGGGNFTTSRRTAFSQGKRVVRDDKDVWNKDHLQSG